MSFERLPADLLLKFLTEAVRVRDLKRALRLRLVCKNFGSNIERAIFDSGILNLGDFADTVYRAQPFWQRYITYQVLRPGIRLGNFGQFIRMTADRIMRFRRGKKDQVCAETDYRQLIEKLSMVPVQNQYFSTSYHDLLTRREEVFGDLPDDEGLWFNQMLLSAATSVGEERLVDALLDNGYNHGEDRYIRSIFDCPLSIAARSGNIKLTKTLLFHGVEGAWPGFSRVHRIILGAAKTSELHIVELGLMLLSSQSLKAWPHFVRWDTTRLYSTCRSAATFRLLHSVVKPLIGARENDWLAERLPIAAELGAIETVEYLIESGAALDRGDCDRYLTCPISRAALYGRGDVVEILLRKSAVVGRSLEAACKGGYPKIADQLLPFSDTNVIQRAFLAAVERENTAIIELFKSRGIYIGVETKKGAVKLAWTHGLDSMVEAIGRF